MKPFATMLPILLSALILGGCVNVPPRDYSLFYQYQPKSILILPPRNLTTELNANYSVFTQSARSLADLGYYIYPTVLVDEYFKQNGILIADEMHAIPLPKLHEIFQADAVLYIDVEAYGTKYVVFSSNNIVVASAVLVDARTGTELWRGRVNYNEPGSSGLIEALIEQLINQLTDQAHHAAGAAAEQLFRTRGQGIPPGFRHPEFGNPPDA